MAKIPEFLLRALYVKGSLRNNEDGFQFQLKNEIGPARIIGARPLQLDRLGQRSEDERPVVPPREPSDPRRLPAEPAAGVDDSVQERQNDCPEQRGDQTPVSHKPL